MTNRPTRTDRAAVGTWVAGPQTPRFSSDALRDAVCALARPLVVVEREGRPAVAEGGQARLGVSSRDGALPLLAWVPPLLPEQLGDPEFRAAHGVSWAYVAGEMANGIASEQLVEAICGAGMLGIFGAAGLSIARIEQAMERLEQNLGARPWGVNLIHSPDDSKLEAAAVELFLRRGLKLVSASAYLELTLPVVRYRVANIHRDQSGAVVVPNRLIAKVSRVEVARKFLSPPPERFLAELVAAGTITAEQASLAGSIPMADDVTGEADSGGHTDNRPLVLLLPALQALRDEICAAHPYRTRPRIGAAGGLATPASIASAFSMGAAYVVTGSINQSAREAGTSDAVRQMLAQAASTDVAMAPAADMFEMGVKVQVLTRGTLFAVRASRLYELYRSCDSVEALPAATRAELEQKYFRCPLEEAWEGCRKFFAERDPRQLERAASEPRHRLALIFRAYLGQASHWANEGVADRRLDYQVWCGPAMGAFNDWARGSFLESWEARRVVVIARNLMTGAAVLTRVAALRTQGVVVPAQIEQFAPRDLAALDALVTPDRSPPDDLESQSVHPERSRGTSHEPIAIVGMGGMFPKAENLTAFWRLLRTAQDAMGDIPETHWSVGDFYDADPRAQDKTYAKRGAFLGAHGFDPTEFGIPPSILEATDTSQLLGLVAARMAMEDAGYGEAVAWDRSRASVLLGVTGTQELVISLGARLGHPRWRQALKDSGVDAQTADQVVERISQSYVGWQESSFPGLLGNVVAGRIANRLDFGGTNCVIDAACASSLGAVHLAVLELRSNRSDLVLTGGVDSLNDIFMHMCFSKTPALSVSGDVRPFSDRADGTLLGEAIGMLVLKRLSDAERDGDRIYATIRGVGTASDGRAKSVYAPLPSGQARALRSAYLEAGVRPRDIDFLEGHGTGTRAGDLAEFEALNQVYREDSSDPAWCALGSVKSQVGHTKAAAGAVGMTKAALALHHKVILPTLKVDAPNPALKIETSPFTLSTQTRPWLAAGDRPRRAGVSAFGFGGSNFHLVLEEHGRKRPAPAWDGSVELIALSAADGPKLLAQAQEAAAVPPDKLAAFAATSREKFRAADPHRLIALRSEALAKAIEQLLREPGIAFSLPEGIHYGVGPVVGRLAFLFPGQGAQHVNMARELACVFPEVLEAVEAAPEVASAIYPAPTFDAAERQRREEHLTRTDVAQPAIGAVSRGLLELLARFGVRPQLVAGHSYGELVALHAAGVLGASQLHEVSRLRGSLMAGNGEDRGTMLAVLAPVLEVERLIAELKLDVVLANRNGPTQAVLAGTRTEISRAEALCQARELRTARLAVGAAFHSPLVSGAAKAFRERLEAVKFEVPAIPVIADATGAPYPSEPSAARDLLGRQLALPVKFDEVVERLYADGARTFVEVGPRSALTGMVRSILGARPHVAIALDAQTRDGGLFDLAQTLARLAAAGHEVQLQQWQRVPAPPRSAGRLERKQKMVVPLTGANYRAPSARPSTPVAPAPPQRIAPVPAGGIAPVLPERSRGTEAPPSSALLELLRANQEAVRALQAQQEQTARIHQTFLEGQLHAQQSFQALLIGQQQLSQLAAGATPVVAAASPPMPVAAPAPVVLAPAVDVIATLLNVVAEATGYPTQTLALAMDMEADLGIDSIKRVEILSMLAKRIPGAPSVNPEKLGALKTLQQVADFVRSPAVAAPVASPAAAPLVDARSTLLAVVAELTGYPLETLALEMDLEADLGIDSIKRVEILSMLSKRIPGAPSVNPEKLGTLKTLQQVLDFIRAVGAPVAIAPAVVAQLHRRVVVPVRLTPAAIAPPRWPEGELLVGVDEGGLAEALVKLWTSEGRKARTIRDAADHPGPIGGLVLIAPDGADWTQSGEQALKRGLQLARAFGPRLREAAARGLGLFAAISRRDGAFGHSAAGGAGGALQGGLAGLVKTAADEWPQVRCRALDVAALLPLAEAARAIVNELGSDGPLEVGLGPAGRTTLGLREAPAMVLANRVTSGDLVVVTGGARGVTAECARALAQKLSVSLLLLGRSAAPAAEPQWMSRATDEAALKRALLEHAAGERPTPKLLGDACRAVLAGREIRASLAALEECGGKVRYASVDVRDEAALARTLEAARADFGPVRGLIHGAGVLRDKRIEDKRDDDLDQVLDTKLAGLRCLLRAAAADDLRFIALMASVSGRFGRRGQSDYAVANQALVSIAQAQAAQRPNCRVVALDWGPWDGGMVTPALRAEFEREGVALIPLAAGARALCDEVQTAPGGPTELVLGAGFAEVSNPGWTLAASHRLDASSYPVLADHLLAGKSVLPLAMTLEWFAQAAIWASAGQPLQSLEDVRVLKGVTAPEDVAIWVGPAERTSAGVRLALELRNGRDQVFVRAAARIGARAAAPAPLSAPAPLRPYPHTVRAIYGEQLFHGARLEAIEAVEGICGDGMVLRLRTHATSERLVPAPTIEWATDPLAVDGVFQALILWCRELRGAPSLPARLGAWRQFKPFPVGSVRATVRVRDVEGAAITSDVDLLDEAGEVVARLEGYVCTVSPTLDRAFHPEAVAPKTVAPSA